MLIDPVIRRPLQAEWDAVKAKIEAALAAPARVGRRTRNGGDTPQALYHGFLERLRRFRVLDPACGSGNFLYLSLQALKDLEHQASVEAEALGLQREFPQVGPETMLGIEINPYAAELARGLAPEQTVLVNVSGRGDKDMDTVARLLGVTLGV